MKKTCLLITLLVITSTGQAELFSDKAGYLPRDTFAEVLDLSCTKTSRYIERFGAGEQRLAAPGNGFEGGLMDRPQATKVLLKIYPGLRGGLLSVKNRLQLVSDKVQPRAMGPAREYLETAEYQGALNTCAGLDALYPAKLAFEDGQLRPLVDEQERNNLSLSDVRRKRSDVFEKAIQSELMTCVDNTSKTSITQLDLIQVLSFCEKIYRAAFYASE